MRNRWIQIAALVLVAAIAGFLTWQKLGPSGETGPFGGPFDLVDQNGQPITEAALRGHPSAIFFGFTHCPEICPTTLFELDSWLATLGAEGDGIKAFFFSVDPERDTPQILGDYISNVTKRVIGITGSPEKMAKVLKDYHIYAKKVPIDGGGYTMDHSAMIILLNSAGGIEGTISWGENPDTAMDKLRRLART